MKDFNKFENLYGEYVQMDDRFETVHIWSESLANENKGRWIPIEISIEEYTKEIKHSWNKVSDIKEERMTPQWMHHFEAFIGKDGNKWAIAKEKAIEENIIKMLWELGIKSSVKTDKHSLPVQGIVLSKARYSSDLSAVYDSSIVKRKFLKEILNNGTDKVRFYVYIHTTERNDLKGFHKMLSKKFHIEIRYYLHE